MIIFGLASCLDGYLDVHAIRWNLTGLAVGFPELAQRKTNVYSLLLNMTTLKILDLPVKQW